MWHDTVVNTYNRYGAFDLASLYGPIGTLPVDPLPLWQKLPTQLVDEMVLLAHPATLTTLALLDHHTSGRAVARLLELKRLRAPPWCIPASCILGTACQSNAATNSDSELHRTFRDIGEAAFRTLRACLELGALPKLQV